MALLPWRLLLVLLFTGSPFIHAYPFVPPNKLLRPFREYQEHALACNESGERMDDGRHSFVEGESFSDRRAELEAMGGDPFFLSDDEQEDEEQDKDNQYDDMESTLSIEDAEISGFMDVIGERYATDGKGPTPPPRKEELDDSDWEWDGTIDEEAHLGFNDW